MDTTAPAEDKTADQRSWNRWGHTEPGENTLDLHNLQAKRRLTFEERWKCKPQVTRFGVFYLGK